MLLTAFPTASHALPAPQWSYTVVAEYPHEVSAFTEGLLVHSDELIESTGLYGRSSLSVRGIHGGKLRRSTSLPPGEFGEGAAIVNEQLYQLTWREGICHVYDFDLRPIKDLRYDGEGWGLTTDGRTLVRSDGSPTLHFHDPIDFREVRRVVVRDEGQPVWQLNELEMAEGRLFANVWMTDRIAVIDPSSGTVIAWLDLQALRARFTLPPGWSAADDVLNGIAYDPRRRHLLVTGKRWPTIFEIAVPAAFADRK